MKREVVRLSRFAAAYKDTFDMLGANLSSVVCLAG